MVFVSLNIFQCQYFSSSRDTTHSEFEKILAEIDRRLDRQEVSAVAVLLDSARSYLETPPGSSMLTENISHIRLALRECYFLVEEEHVEAFQQLWKKTGLQLTKLGEEADLLRAKHHAVKAWHFAKTTLDSSIFYCDSAERILESMSLPDLPLLTRLWQTRAIAYYTGASPLESINATDRALEYAAKSNPAHTDSVLWGTLYNLRSALHFGFQEFEETIFWLEKFRQTQPDSPSFEARYLGNLAAVYYVQYQFDRAIELNRQAIHIRQSETDKMSLTRLAENYGNQGQFFLTVDELDSAAHYMELALFIRENKIERRDISIAATQHSLGNIYMEKGEMDKADSLLSEAKMLYQLTLPPYSRVLGDYYDVYSTYLKRSGNIPEALEQRQNGLRVAMKEPDKLKALDNPKLEDILLPAQALSNMIAKAELQYTLYRPGRMNELNTALETAELAYTLSKQIRSDIHAKRFHWAIGQNLEPLHQLLVKGYIERYEQKGMHVDLVSAYSVVQTGKSEMLRRMRREADAFERISIPDSLRNQVTGLQRRLWRIESMLSLLESNPVNPRFASLQDSLTYLSGRHATSLKSLAAKSERFRMLYADTTEVQIEDLQESLRKRGKNLLNFFIVDEYLYSFAVLPDTLILTKVAMDSSFNTSLDKLLQSTRFPGSDFSSYISVAEDLYSRIIAPVHPFFTGNNLLISPDRELHKIPYEALLTTNSEQIAAGSYDRLAYLSGELNIQYTYSYTFSSLKGTSNKKNTKENSFIGFAPGFEKFNLSESISGSLHRYFPNDAKISISPLPYSQLEIESIQNRFLEQKSSLPTVLGRLIYTNIESFSAAEASESHLYQQDLSKTEYLHFSTHGLYDPDNPSKTALLLQPDQKNDGLVLSSDIYGLDINAKLVVLNACESALGYWSAGEGIVSPAQAFLVAGAENVLVALWKTENRSTAFFFDHFYGALLSGKSHVQALRVAREACLNSEDFRHPFYWAGFILIG